MMVGLQKMAVAWFRLTSGGLCFKLTSGQQPPFALPGLDVLPDRLLRPRADHGTHVVRRIIRLTHGDLLRTRLELFEEPIVNRLMHDRPRARRTLLPLIPERGHSHAFHRGIEVTIAVDDDRVLAAHLRNYPFDPDLAFLRLGGELIDVQAHVARSGERNETRLRMRHQKIADRAAAAGQETERMRRKAGFEQRLGKHRRDRRCLARRLDNDGIPVTSAAHVIPHRIASGKFQGGITTPTPSGR